MRSSLPLRLAATALATGFLVGVLFPLPFHGPDPASATGIAVWVGVHPGASTTLTCGWHGTCYEYPDAPTSGSALDWRNQGTTPPVYWRSYGTRWDQYSSTIAVGTINAMSGGLCKLVRVEVEDAYGFGKGHIDYTHSWTYTHEWDFNIAGGGGSAAWTSVEIAYSIPPYPYGDNQGCPNTAQHLHQGVSSQWVKQTSNYHTPPCYRYQCTPTPGNDGEGTVYPITNLGMNQYSQVWCWSGGC